MKLYFSFFLKKIQMRFLYSEFRAQFRHFGQMKQAKEA